MTTVIPDQPQERPEPPGPPESAEPPGPTDPPGPAPEPAADVPTDEEAVSVIAAARAWLVAIGYRRPGADR